MLGMVFHHGELRRWAGCGGAVKLLGLRAALHWDLRHSCLPSLPVGALCSETARESCCLLRVATSELRGGHSLVLPWGRTGGLVLPQLNLDRSRAIS